MIYEKWGNLKFKYRNREYWCRGYYVDTAGKNAVKIKEYIKNQLKEDELGEQLTFNNTDPFMGSKYQSFRKCQTVLASFREAVSIIEF